MGLQSFLLLAQAQADMTTKNKAIHGYEKKVEAISPRSLSDALLHR